MRLGQWTGGLTLLLAACGAACGVEQDFGAPAVAPASDAGTNANRGGGAGEQQRFTGDATAPAALTACPTGRLCWANPLPTGDDFSGIWASADDDVWLATVTGTLLHWDGAKFETRYQSTTETTSALLHGFARDDVWLVLNDSPTWRSMHWDGTSWSDRTATNPFTMGPLVAISGLAGAKVPAAVMLEENGTAEIYAPTAGVVAFSRPTDLASMPEGTRWVDVFAATKTDDVPGGTVIWALRSDGHLVRVDAFEGAWQSEPDDPGAGTAAIRGVGVWGTSATDVWEVLEERSPNATTEVFRHFDGSAWTTVQREDTVSQACVQGGYCGSPGRTIWGRTASDVWVAGGGAMWHYDGHAWATATQNWPSDSEYAVLFGTNTSLWLAGDLGRLHTWSGDTWTQIAGGDKEGTVVAISARRDDDVWAVQNQMSLAYGSAGLRVLHFDGTSWTTLPALAKTPWPRFMQSSGALAAFAPTDAWITAVIGTDPDVPYDATRRLVHWDGVAWTVESDVSHVSALWGSAASDLWAASAPEDTQTEGAAGVSAVHHWSGAAWTTLPVDSLVTSISGTAADDVWFYGPTTLLHWDGASLTSKTLPAPSLSASRVLVTSRGDVWLYDSEIVGESSENVWHGDGSAWTMLTMPAVHAAWATGSNDVWFVGKNLSSGGGVMNALLLHWDGRQLERDYSSIVGPELYAVAGAGPDDMWVGGAGGGILRTSFDANASAR